MSLLVRVFGELNPLLEWYNAQMSAFFCANNLNKVKSKKGIHVVRNFAGWIVNSLTFHFLIYIYTVGTESIQTPLNFSLFVILQPFAKII